METRLPVDAGVLAERCFFGLGLVKEESVRNGKAGALAAEFGSDI